MARRSSARLRERSTTPKRVSLSHDAPTRATPKTVPAKLSAVEESDEMPGAFPQSASPYPRLPQPDAAETPTRAAPIKPAEEEMHPQLYHQTTAQPRDEARHLGFSNMAPHTEPPRKSGTLATLHGTPTKTRNLEQDTKSPSYQFTFRREHSLELSPEAKKLMFEKREEAARIREQMIADGDAPQSIDAALAGRKVAKPKGRFSQAHMQEFGKMDSIAGHASAFRADPNRSKTVTEQKETKSLKRSPSKAGLDQSSTPSRPTSREGAKPTPSTKGSALPRSASFRDLKQAAEKEASPAKRIKRADADDVSVNRPASSEREKSLPTTPNKIAHVRPNTSNLAALSTPTQASLARAASVKSVKFGSKIPAPQFTPAKSAAPAKVPTSILKKPSQPEQPKVSTPLLARSPAKATIFPDHVHAQPSATVDKPASMMSSTLARTPAKSGLFKKATESDETHTAPKGKPVPFLSRSPVKVTVAKPTEEDPFEQKTASAAIPFLSRSPTKLPKTAGSNAEETPGKSLTSKLHDRFALLRQSPMKSILRSPQRLYSDDPAKVASGTHLATPPGKKAADMNKTLPAVPAATAVGQKRVDFSSSTKARDLKTQSDASSSDSKTPTSLPKRDGSGMAIDKPEQQKDVEATAYPHLPLEIPTYDRMPSLSPTPQKRRQTAGPQDFTFRAGEQDIVFAQSPNAPASAANTKKRKFEFENQIATASIDKVVSPPAGTKKRKFEFENKLAAAKAEPSVDVVSDKENTPVVEDDEEDPEQRPAKRAKGSGPSAATAPTAASAARRTTLGVKPKGIKTASPVKKRASTISQARLAALSAPKKRN